MRRTILDSKGRILIPNKIRKKAWIAAGERVRPSVDDRSVVIKKSVSAEEFIRDTEGAIKRGSKIKVADPLKLKEIWGKP